MDSDSRYKQPINFVASLTWPREKVLYAEEALTMREGKIQFCALKI